MGRSTMGDFWAILGNVLEKIMKTARGSILLEDAMFVQLTRKRSETRYICKFCLVPIHKEECFQRYHTLMHYWSLGKCSLKMLVHKNN
jgi:hypothetical protein